VEGGSEQADRLAAEAGLINLGEVIPGTWLINPEEVHGSSTWGRLFQVHGSST
jgi:hypothetical protein